MADTELVFFDCAEELINEVDALAASHFLDRTDVVLFAAQNLLDFMEAHRRTSQSIPDFKDEDIAADIEAMIAPAPEPIDPDANVVEPLLDGEESGILLLKRRKR